MRFQRIVAQSQQYCNSTNQAAKLHGEKKANPQEILSSNSGKIVFREELQSAQIPRERETHQIMSDARFSSPHKVTRAECDTAGQSSTLTEQQKADIEDLLSTCNTEGFSFSDTSSVRDGLISLGIPLSKETFEFMYNAVPSKPEGVIETKA